MFIFILQIPLNLSQFGAAFLLIVELMVCIFHLYQKIKMNRVRSLQILYNNICNEIYTAGKDKGEGVCYWDDDTSFLRLPSIVLTHTFLGHICFIKNQ